MKALVELIDRYQPGFAAQVQPADADLVEALHELAGPFPGAYQRFLATMGGDMAGFEPLGVTFDVEARLSNYQTNRSLHGSPFLLVAGGGGPIEPGGPLFMDRSRPSGRDDCLLVVAPYSHHMRFEEATPLHVGLEEFLYVEAYRSIRLKRFAFRANVSSAADVSPDASVAAELFERALALGFARVPPAARSALFERGNAAMVVYRHPFEERFTVHFGGADGDELRRVMDALLRDLPVQRVRP